LASRKTFSFICCGLAGQGIPFGINFLFGDYKNLEAGVVFNPVLVGHVELDQFVPMLVGNVGYRVKTKSGLIFRIGFTPFIELKRLKYFSLPDIAP